MSTNIKYNYENLLQFALKYNCEILDSKQIINSKPDLIKVKSRCGHNTMTSFNKFLKYKIGVYCKECMEQITLNNTNLMFSCVNLRCNKDFVPKIDSFIFCSKFCSRSRIQTKETIEKIIKSVNKNYMEKIKFGNNLNYSDVFTQGNEYIINLLKNKINLEITNRTCIYNHIVKPSIDEKDLWMPFEIKYSNTIKDSNYYFTIKKKYTNTIMLFVSLSDKKYWLFPPNIISTNTKIKININNKYLEYFIIESKLADKIIEYFYLDKSLHLSKEIGIMPIVDDLAMQRNHHSIIEYEYYNLRTKSINFINFECPLSNFQTYNFKINGFKIQESVSFICKNNRYHIVSLHKRSKGKSSPFNLYDSDYYWINKRNTDIFYVIPEIQMNQHHFLATGSEKGKTSINIDINEDWIFTYKFNYSTINEFQQKQKFLSLFNLI